MAHERPAGAPHDSERSEQESRTVDKDDAFHVLQNRRRRAVLRYLLDHDDREQVRMRDLAEEVAAWEHDTTVRGLTSDERQRVYIALYQSHLPKLDEYGVIEYNQSRGIVEPTRLVRIFEPFVATGLHADSDRLSLASDDDPAADSPSGRGLASALSTLLAE